jgi:hypothetical protein
MKKYSSVFHFILAASVTLCSLAGADAATGLAGYWSFNEGTGTIAYDSSGNGNNGTISGAQWTSGISGTALQFGGSSMVSVPDNSALRPTTVTVEAWIYADNFQASNFGMIATKEYSTMASYRMQLHSTNGTVQFVTSNSWGSECVGSTVLTNGQWHQVDGVWANGTLKVYVDGNLDGSGARAGTPAYSTDPLQIGYASNTGNPFSGKIDEVKIFNYELTADTILAHYNTGIQGSTNPSSPALSAPINGATNQSLAPTLSWGVVPGAGSYGVQVSSGTAFSSTIFEQTGLVATSLQIANLTPGTTYFWRANATAAGTGSWSPIWSFSTMPPAPDAPALASPANGASNQPLALTLAWSSAAGASTYAVQVSTGLSFLATVATLTGVSSTSGIIGGLTANTVYYWRASATNLSGTSNWSSAWYFTTVPPAPNVPVPSAPLNGSANLPTTLLLSWNSSNGAATYGVQISTSVTFATQLANWSGLSSLSQSISGISNNTTIYWRVNAAGTGGTSAWSTTWSFITIPQIASAPLLSAPANGASGQATALTLSWNAATGTVTSYAVQVSTNASFATTVFAQTGTGLTAAAGGLAFGGITYFWRVGAVNVAGTSWSNSWSFMTTAVPAIPTLVSPINASTFTNGQQVTLTWAGIPSAVFYTVQVSTVSGFGSVTASQSVLTPSFQFTPARGVVNYWRVSATNAAGTGAWSTIWTLTPSVGVLLSLPLQKTGEFSLKQGSIAYTLAERQRVEISLYDMLGRSAMTRDCLQDVGSYSLDLKRSELPAGEYIVRFKAGAIEKKGMLLLVR